MKRIKITGFPVIGAVLFVISNFAIAELSADPIEELKNCARTDDDTARIACYEALGKRVLGEEAVSVVPSRDDAPVVREDERVVADVVKPSRQPEKIAGADVEATTETVFAHVRSCRRAADGKWIFVFDNGQIWKQSGRGNYRFKNCDFDVTFKKDLFGYKIKIDGHRPLRVRRRK